MTLTGLNRRTQATFPVDVATDASCVFVRCFVLEPRNPGPGIDILITLGYAVNADGPPRGHFAARRDRRDRHRPCDA